MVLLYKHSAASSDPHRLRAAHGSKGGYPLANHDNKRGCSHCGWESYSKSGIAVCYVMCMMYRYIYNIDCQKVFQDWMVSPSKMINL